MLRTVLRSCLSPSFPSLPRASSAFPWPSKLKLHSRIYNLSNIGADEALGRRGRRFHSSSSSALEEPASTSEGALEGKERVEMDDEVIRSFFVEAEAKLGIQAREDWYRVTPARLKGIGGAAILKARGPLFKALQVAFPERVWHPWLFPRGFWKEKENQKAFLSCFCADQGKDENDPETWYASSPEDLSRRGGSQLMAAYGNSLFRLLRETYPQLGLLPWKFKYIPKLFWTKKENQRMYLDWLGRKLGFRTREDWYRVTAKDFTDNDVPKGYFDLEMNRREYLNWLLETVKVSEYKELNANHFTQNHGSGLLAKYGGSPHLVVDSLRSTTSVPDYIPRNYWANKSNQRQFMDNLAAKLGFSPNDFPMWYNISHEQIESNGGRAVLGHYGQSLYTLLKAVYREHDWLPWKFSSTPRGLWSDEEVLRRVVRYVEDSLKFKSKEDWHRISKDQLRALGVENFFVKNGGVAKALEKVNSASNSS